MDQKIIDLYDRYTHGLLGRRDFLSRLAGLAGGTAAASALLPLLQNDYARAEIVRPDDPRLNAEIVKYPGATGEVRACLAAPKGEAKLPGVVVIHENRGLNPHIEDVARRAALDGFLALAPDALSQFGGTPQDEDKARELIGKLDSQATLNNFLAAVTYLKNHPRCTGKVGAVGFCWGGGMANQLAVNSTDLRAAVAFYGRQPEPQDVPRIKAALLLHYAGLDERINSGIPAFGEALKKAGVAYKIYMYEGANHAFHNDTNAARYDKAAGQLAWQRTVEFLKEKLKS